MKTLEKSILDLKEGTYSEDYATRMGNVKKEGIKFLFWVVIQCVEKNQEFTDMDFIKKFKIRGVYLCTEKLLG